jgi:hypothetical protein
MSERTKPIPTKYAIRLSNALKKEGIDHELEHWDGHKHVDIAILWAKVYIEVIGDILFF